MLDLRKAVNGAVRIYRGHGRAEDLRAPWGRRITTIIKLIVMILALVAREGY